MTDPTVVFAGDREVAVEVLEFLTENEVDVAGLLLPPSGEASHDEKILELVEKEETHCILRGSQFREEAGKRLLKNISPEYILSVHFQYIFPEDVLSIPKHGIVNLHPAYLPYNRGWHTPSWAILDQTPYGATLHFMNEEIDSGEIIARKEIDIRPEDTADSLYSRVMDVEVELFKSTWPKLADFSYQTTAQSESEATIHTKDDLKKIQKIDLDNHVEVGRLLRKLRALTTNKLEEAAYFERDGDQYRVQIDITAEEESE